MAEFPPRQAPGTWMVNKVTCCEMVDLMKVFESMSTIVKFANTTLGKGGAEAAKKIYIEALRLFTMLENGKGVSVHLFLAIKLYGRDRTPLFERVSSNFMKAIPLSLPIIGRFFTDLID